MDLPYAFHRQELEKMNSKKLHQDQLKMRTNSRSCTVLGEVKKQVRYGARGIYPNCVACGRLEVLVATLPPRDLLIWLPHM